MFCFFGRRAVPWDVFVLSSLECVEEPNLQRRIHHKASVVPTATVYAHRWEVSHMTLWVDWGGLILDSASSSMVSIPPFMFENLQLFITLGLFRSLT